MTKFGLHFIQNVNPRKEDHFKEKKLYRYRSKKAKQYTTIIELEIYEKNNCVISFYQKNLGNDKNKYRRRAHLSAGHILAILTSCIEAYAELEYDHSFIFSAANDLGENIEENKRFSLYDKFLERRFPKYEEYERNGSIATNTLMLFHRSFQYKNDALEFFRKFKEKTIQNIINSNQDFNE
ncbi:hypothetical protein K4L44_15270 [Halosquirtibacter laminarini]|uniref:Uncharacterized protein n=1 Tax=Halosquirtibacter laminarini TaxID=3374600 RepID=A0AC61NE88_9BACT|nr:hypothetical protein K4L44_15270 [Prolixibacteraceae bacterium]